MIAAATAWCLVTCAMTSIAEAQVYKCQDPADNTVYADAPCAPGGKPLRLQDPTTPAATNATACTQLLDETRRLDAEAQRDAKRGKPADMSLAKRRQTLAGEYQRRCVGISRSTP